MTAIMDFLRGFTLRARCWLIGLLAGRDGVAVNLKVEGVGSLGALNPMAHVYIDRCKIDGRHD